ncbi:DUF4157 domain-containing protein [Streptomyces sp. Tu 2975]|uniref:eCIS core domain-containing protein n=1 Tax=Streptomyces sp. Tu 2975 TaxID=2676871 RepID=UPI0024475C46|nr:DUF4157 domain-containing protein [Streptomyces sp. Tu 2975]
MSTAHSQESRSDQAGKRRKRKDRDRSGTVEPKNIVSGAGQPLDVSVRRELEEQLGHDFGRVRLHTDRDAGALTEMLGADAVAVGQDIFFREGAYRPGTVDGQRLLAHELLHTVQNPHGLGTLRAGRDLGAVSLPQQAMEREVESAARDLVREEGSASEVEPGQTTPGWLRYARVDADRNRLEQIDPATLVDRLTNSVVRSLRGDPEDRSKRTRRQLARLPEELQDSVLDRLESRLLSSEHERLLDIVDELDGDEEQKQEQGSLDAPHAESDLFDEVALEREQEQRAAEAEQENQERPAPAPGPEKEHADTEGAPGSTPQNGGTAQDGTTPEGGHAPQGGEQSGTDGGQEPSAPPAAPQQDRSAAAGDGAGGGGSSSGGAPASGQPAGEKKESGAEGGKEGEEQQAAAPSEEESAARNRPGAVDALTAGQQIRPEDKARQDKPGGSPTSAGRGVSDPGPFSRLDGVRNQDLDGPQNGAEEELSDSTSEVEVGGGEKSAWDIKLQPEDFLPEQDLDVSAVPTADGADPAAAPAVPSFPAPPVTRADKVQADRDAEDAEDAAAEAETDEDDAAAPADAEPSADEEENAPDGTDPGEAALERAAAALPAPGPASKDPKSGADPKAGPVAAQTAVQEKPGTSESGDATQEAAAKEEKGTAAAGDRPAAAQEKSSPQAAGGTAGPDPVAKQEQKPPAPAPAATGEQAAGAPAPSPARDTHVTGGSNADTPGGASSNAAGEAEGPSPDPAPAQSPRRGPAPALPRPPRR